MASKNDKSKEVLTITVSFKAKKDSEVELYNDIIEASDIMAVSQWMKIAAKEKLQRDRGIQHKSLNKIGFN